MFCELLQTPYIIIIIIIIKLVAWIFLTLSYHLSNRLSLLVGPLDGPQCLYRADKYKSLLISKHWYVHVLESIGELHLLAHCCFSSSAQCVLFILHKWFMNWELSDCTTVVLWVAASRICWNQYAASLCSPQHFFSKHFIKVHMVLPYNHTVMAIAEKNSHLILSKRLAFCMVHNLSIAVHVFPICVLTLLLVDEILLPRYENYFINFRGLSFNAEMAASCL